jgi:tetratricopeptide (TPR) repeat protein
VDSVYGRLTEALGVALRPAGPVDIPAEAYRHYSAAATELSGRRGRGAGGFILSQQVLDRIETNLRSALDEEPGFAAAVYLLALMEARRGRYGEALKRYRAAVLLDGCLGSGPPGDLLAKTISDCQAAGQHVAQGTPYLERRKHREALEEYSAAVRIMPDYAEAHANLGLVHMLLGNLSAAVHEQREAIRLKPDLAEAHYNLGNALARREQFAEAAAAFREAIRLKPDNAAPDSIVGMIDAGQGKYTEKVARHQAAVRHAGLANALYGMRDLAGSAEEYERALELEPGFADAHFNLAVIHEETGNPTRAERHWAAYLRIARRDPAQADWIPEAEARLRRLRGD